MARSGVHKIGDWNRVKLLIGNLSKEIEISRLLALKQFGLKAEGTAKSHLSMQDLPWVALAPKTIAAKVRRGESENTLIATSDYLQSITSYVHNGVSYAGVRKESINNEGDVIADIARVHEYGTKDIPARPLWQPTFVETLKWFKKSSDSRPDVIFMKRIQKYM